MTDKIDPKADKLVSAAQDESAESSSEAIRDQVTDALGNSPQTETGEKEINEISDDPSVAIRQLFSCGLLLAKEKKWKDCEAALQAAIDLKEHDPSIAALSAFHLGAAYEEAGFEPQASVAYEMALELGLDEFNIKEATSAYCNLGQIFLRQKEFSKAEFYFKQAIELKGANPEAAVKAAYNLRIVEEQDPPIASADDLMNEFFNLLDQEGQDLVERLETSELLWRFAFLKVTNKIGATPKQLAENMAQVTLDDLAFFKSLFQKKNPKALV